VASAPRSGDANGTPTSASEALGPELRALTRGAHTGLKTYERGFTVSELQFPAGYVQDPFGPELPYLALVLQGGLEKSFRF
jgi:hypothetical protein